MTAPKVESARYGATELKQVYHRYFWRGFIIAVAIHAVLIGGYYVAQAFEAPEPPLVKVRLRPTELPPSPPIGPNRAPVVNPTTPMKPRVGVPAPVPDAEVSPESTLANQYEYNPMPDAIPDGGGGYEYEPEIEVPEEGPPADFVPVERQPEIVLQVKPAYPELALRANLEGTVWVKLWVDKIGHVREARVLKSDADIFNDAAIAAGKQFTFTPAYMNNGPVAVWVSLPFRFRLTEKK